METNSKLGEKFGQAPRISWLPLFLFSLLAGLSLTLWYFLNSKEQATNKQSIQIQADFVLSQIDVDFKHRLASMNWLAREWNTPNGISLDEFTLDAGSIMVEHPGFQAIEWVDSNYIIK